MKKYNMIWIENLGIYEKQSSIFVNELGLENILYFYLLQLIDDVLIVQQTGIY